MKKYIIIALILVLINVEVKAQDWGDAVWCHRNVYDPVMSGASRKECIDATFKYNWNTIEGGTVSCTGTLINRNTDDGSIGFYFLSSRHCFQRNTQDQFEMDPNQPIDFYFNYQSKDANNSAVPVSNQGTRKGFQSRAVTHNDYEFRHQSRIRIVSAFVWGDMMLCEILTPLPPHFNITYAGWNPNPFRFGGLTSGEFVGIHHPSGDIKKLAKRQLFKLQLNQLSCIVHCCFAGLLAANHFGNSHNFFFGF